MNATVVLVFNLFEVENLGFLFLDGLDELVDVSLLFVTVDLVIVFVLNYV